MKHPNRPVEIPAVRPGRRRLLTALVAAGWGLLPGCGGGDPLPGAGPAATRKRPLGGVDSGGTGKTKFRTGVESVAPLAASGVAFDTRAASFVDADGQPFDEASLAPGMSVDIDAGSVVVVDGQATAPARTVRRAEQLLGPLQSVSAASGSLQVWNQTVIVTTGTVLDPALAADWTLLPPGTPLRIWGQLDTVRRRIVATRIDRPEAAAVPVLRGVLTQLDRATGQVAIGALRLAPAPGHPVPLPDDLAVGDVVRVQVAPGTPPTLAALRADPVVLSDAERATIDGRVGTMDSPTRFEVDGVPVEAAAAAFSGGLPTPGSRVTVTGAAENGELRATSVVVAADEIDEVAELEGAVQSVDTAAGRFVVRRTTVQWTASTRFDGGTPVTLKPRRKVAVKGRRGGARGVVEAFYVKVED